MPQENCIPERNQEPVKVIAYKGPPAGNARFAPKAPWPASLCLAALPSHIRLPAHETGLRQTSSPHLPSPVPEYSRLSPCLLPVRAVTRSRLGDDPMRLECLLCGPDGFLWLILPAGKFGLCKL